MIRNSIQHGKYTFGVIVDDKRLLEESFRLRFQVYAEEFGFEKKEDHPGGLETDEYEDAAIHCVCLDDQEKVVGTVRLILDSDKGFPIEHAVPNLSIPWKMPDRKKIAEISRLAISKKQRRKKNDVLPDDRTDYKETQDSSDPIIVLGLYQIMYHESKRQGITHWYMIVEKKLYDAANRFGFEFHQIGEPVWYHGERIPFLGTVEGNEQSVRKFDPNLFEVMIKGLEKKYQPHCHLNDA
ncbi:MAG: long-chain N-acyl amino acid synthase [Deltaproteobacteria bacterium]|nr:MAG: long-chain N-acyl amino acid synthase [Deltaproteobacteria bacterium]